MDSHNGVLQDWIDELRAQAEHGIYLASVIPQLDKQKQLYEYVLTKLDPDYQIVIKNYVYLLKKMEAGMSGLAYNIGFDKGKKAAEQKLSSGKKP